MGVIDCFVLGWSCWFSNAPRPTKKWFGQCWSDISIVLVRQFLLGLVDRYCGALIGVGAMWYMRLHSAPVVHRSEAPAADGGLLRKKHFNNRFYISEIWHLPKIFSGGADLRRPVSWHDDAFTISSCYNNFSFFQEGENMFAQIRQASDKITQFQYWLMLWACLAVRLAQYDLAFFNDLSEWTLTLSSCAFHAWWH
jgi:hypothetical protein